MENVLYLIIGGGISGLSFARNISNESYLIIEKETSLGGLCRTHYNGEYVWDYAGHFFHFSNPRIKAFFDSRINDSELVTRVKNTKIYYKGRYVNFPFQKNIHQLPQNEFIDCLYDLFFKEKYADFGDFEEMLYAKFGRSITEKFLKPYNEKLYACSLKKLDVNSMGRFFPYADIEDIIRNMKEANNSSYNTTFDYPKRGAQLFIDALSADINMEYVWLNADVNAIDVKSHSVKIGDREVIYDYLINTIPFNHLLKLCSIQDKEQVLSSNQVLVFNIGFDSALNETECHWIYYPSKEFVFYRVGFYNNILQSKNGSIYVEIGYDKEKMFSDASVQDIFDKTIVDLKKCGIISSQKIVAYESLLINPGYVHITDKSTSWVNRVSEELGEKGHIYSIGRYGVWTYCSMEDCIIQADNLYNELKDKR